MEANQIPVRIEEQLMELGFTNYEARVYRAVYRLKECSISQINTFSKVPTAKIYSIIKKLEEKGLIIEIPSARPAQYRAHPPDQIIDKMLNRFSEIGKNLKKSFKDLRTEPLEETGTILIRNELLVKNLILDELKVPPQDITFVVHEDFDFYAEVLRKVTPSTSVVLIDPHNRELDEFMQNFPDLTIQIIPFEQIPTDLSNSLKNLPIFLVLDEKIYVNISQQEQILEYLFIKSRNFSEFLRISLKNFIKDDDGS